MSKITLLVYKIKYFITFIIFPCLNYSKRVGFILLRKEKTMKKGIKTLVLGLATISMLTGCFEKTSSSQNSSDSPISSTVVKTDISLTANKTTLEIGEELLISANVEGASLTTTTGATITSGVFKATEAGTYVVTAHKEGDYNDGTITITVLTPKESITLTANKVALDLNESVTITSNIEGVTLTTTEGATITNGVFTASKEGTYVVTGHKEGRYNDGTLTITVAFDSSETKVRSTLKALKETQNYTLKATSLLGSFNIYRTPNYFFDSEFNEGMGLFTNIIAGDSHEKVAHYIKLNEDQLVIGNDVVYLENSAPTIATDLYMVDGFHFIDLDKVTFEEKDGKYVTKDAALISAIAGTLNSEIANYAIALQYSFNKNYELVANVLFPAEDGETIDYATASTFGDLVYTNIGTTKAPVLDDLYANVTVGGEGMSNDVASSFMLNKANIKATIKQIVDEEETLLGTSEYTFDEKYLVEEKNIRGNVSRYFYQKGDDGYAYYVGVNSDNELTSYPYAEWTAFTFPFAKLDISQFRLTGEHTYSYLGYESNAVACDLAWASLGENQIAYITAKEENGKIVSFTCETANYLTELEDESMVISKYVMEIEVLPYETIADPKPFEADADTVRVNAYLSELNGANANYTMFLGDHYIPSDYKTIKVTENTILITEYKNKEYSYRGYHVLSDGIIAFTATNEDGEVKAKLVRDIELNDGQSFASLLGLKIAPETMKFDVDGNIVFKDNVLDGGKGLFNEFKYGQYAIESTVEFIISNGHVGTINFKYADGQTTAEYAQLYGYGTTSFTSTFEKKLLEILPNIRNQATPTTWEEEQPNAYAKILALVGEDNIGLVPYVYDPAYTGHFNDGTLNAAGNMVTIKVLDNLTFTDAYRLKITEACVALGYTKNSNTKATLALSNGKSLIVQTLGTAMAVSYK